MNTNRIFKAKLVEIAKIERYELDNKEILNYKLNFVKWGLFYKVGKYYIDLETLTSYKITELNSYSHVFEKSIDPRSISYFEYDKNHISYKQIKRILKNN